MTSIRHTLRLCAMVLTMLLLGHSISAATAKRQFTVVIDAGHGGHDAGALGKTTKEKDINLAVAKALGEIFRTQHKDIKVVFTRTTDVFVTLDGRVQKAKNANADLFISLHCNSAAYENKNRQNLSGTSVYVLGPDAADANLDIAIRENQSILLEPDHTTRYQGFDNSPEYYIFAEISQNKMQGKSNDVAASIQHQLTSHAGLKDNKVRESSKIFLLKHATVPTVLVEMDFICNPQRERYLNSATGQQKIAQAICNGVVKFRNSNPASATDRNDTDTSAEASEPETQSDTDNDQATTSGNITYRIQFLTSPRKLADGASQFKGLERVTYYTEGRSYKYTCGEYQSQKAASADLKKVRKKYPDAFIIKMRDGKRIK